MKRLRCDDNKPQPEVWCLFLKILVGTSTARERKKVAVAGAKKCDGFLSQSQVLTRRPALLGSAVK